MCDVANLKYFLLIPDATSQICNFTHFLALYCTFPLSAIVFQYFQFLYDVIDYIYLFCGAYLFFMNINWGHTLYAVPKTTRDGTVYFQVCLSSCYGGAVVSIFMIHLFIVKKRWKIFVYLPYCLLFTG